MSHYQVLDENFNLNKYYRCDQCGKLLAMDYLPTSRPPKPWKSVDTKENGFYLQKDYCPDCKDIVLTKD